MIKSKFHFSRITILIILSFFITGVIILKLAFLQIVHQDYYSALAQQEHAGYTELPARRGEILTRDYHSNETFKLATNIGLDLLYADPTLIENPQKIAETLASIIIDLEEEKKLDQKRVEQEWAKAPTEEERNKIKPSTDEELLKNYSARLAQLLSNQIRDEILMETSISKEALATIMLANLPGIKIVQNALYAYPKEIENIEKTAELLSPLLSISKKELKRILIGKNRYVIIKRKISPDASKKIYEWVANDATNLWKGIGLSENYYRYYPENSLAAQILGFIDQNNEGQYGIENTFNQALKGKEGVFSSKKDASGQLITVGESVIRPAVDGDDIVLTIDRAIQLEIEKKLAKAVDNHKAENGQVIVMDPKTGKILALANYPTFNPNEYGTIFEKKEIALSEDEIKNLVPIGTEENPTHFWLYTNNATNQRLEIFKETDENNSIRYKIYKNTVGPKVYRNLAISDVYEPGSVFKAITMASALNAGEVTPSTVNYDNGPIKVDEYEIHNSLDKYYGRETMTQVLEHSANVGISFVARKLGRNLFYNYMLNFGFNERTDIELGAEHPGQIEFYSKWAESELLTHGFGQGILVTPIQMVTAIAAIANDGVLMQPYIVDSMVKDSGEIISTEPKNIRRVITKETADTLTAMLVSAVENGVASRAKVAGHYIAGKTGTSQTYKHGKALTGAGTTIASIAGFGPVEDPKFVILIKFDRPLTSPWADATVAPLMSEIAEYLFNYYNIPPDKE